MSCDWGEETGGMCETATEVEGVRAAGILGEQQWWVWTTHLDWLSAWVSWTEVSLLVWVHAWMKEYRHTHRICEIIQKDGTMCWKHSICQWKTHMLSPATAIRLQLELYVLNFHNIKICRHFCQSRRTISFVKVMLMFTIRFPFTTPSWISHSSPEQLAWDSGQTVKLIYRQIC